MAYKSIFLLLWVILLFSQGAGFAKNVDPEKPFRDSWCAEHGGRTDVLLPGGGRAHCVTETHVVEFSFAAHWDRALGRALVHGMRAGKTPGVVLILREEKEFKNWIELVSTISHFNLPVTPWLTGKGAREY